MDNKENLEDAVKFFNARSGNSADCKISRNLFPKSLVETARVQDFAKALLHDEGLELRNIRANKEDPPDCFATLDSRELSIEVVELVDGEAIGIAKNTGITSQSGISAELCEDGNWRFTDQREVEAFRRGLWSRERFECELNKCLDRKHEKYSKRGYKFDCLLITTDEAWLLPEDVEKWLSEGVRFTRRSTLSTAYLLMGYSPTYREGTHPLFNLYGSLSS